MNDAAVIEKIIVEGKLIAKSPLMIGAGENDGLTDTLVLRDKNEQAYIPGTSLAGVLRSMVLASCDEEMALSLFGDLDMGWQSSITVLDVPLSKAKTIIRDSVCIDTYTGVGIEGAKFDYEAIAAGAEGDFQLVITLRYFHAQKGYKDDVVKLVNQIADQLMQGIHLGARTTKGFGLVQCVNVKSYYYDFAKPQAVKAWLTNDKKGCQVYNAKPQALVDENSLVVEGDFRINGSLIVREAGEDDNTSTMLGGKNDYIIPGTTVKGIIRKQSQKIADYLGLPESFIPELMGYADKNTLTKQKSRLMVDEIYLPKEEYKKFKHTRNRLDRFTGGTVDTALFSSEPIYDIGKGTIKLRFTVKSCSEAEAGLLLLVLKDIWTGQVAFGGEKSVGRGTLLGQQAHISFGGEEIIIKKAVKGDDLKFEGDVDLLETCVLMLQKAAQKGV